MKINPPQNCRTTTKSRNHSKLILKFSNHPYHMIISR